MEFFFAIPLAEIIPKALLILIFTSSYSLIVSFGSDMALFNILGCSSAMQPLWCSSKYHIETQLEEASEFIQWAIVMLRKGQTDAQEGRPLTQGNRASWLQSPGWNPRLLTQHSPPSLTTARPGTHRYLVSRCPLSLLLGSRAEPQFLLPGKCTKSADFLLSSNLFSWHTPSPSAVKKTPGFLDDPQSWLKTHPASFSNYLSSIWASNAWPASQSPLSHLDCSVPFLSTSPSPSGGDVKEGSDRSRNMLSFLIEAQTLPRWQLFINFTGLMPFLTNS